MTHLPSLRNTERSARQLRLAYKFAVCLLSIRIPWVSEIDAAPSAPITTELSDRLLQKIRQVGTRAGGGTCTLIGQE